MKNYLRNFVKNQNPQESGMGKKSAGNSLGVPADFPETPKSAGNSS
jgi:hypothetical protein